MIRHRLCHQGELHRYQSHTVVRCCYACSAHPLILECPVRLASLLVAVVLVVPVRGQEGSRRKTKPTGPKPRRVEITPRTVETMAGQQLTFSAAGYDDAGNKMDAQPSAWFAAPFDLAFADDKGIVTFTGAGDVRVGAIVNGKTGFIAVTVRPQAVARVTIAKPRAALAVGTGLTLHAQAEMANGDPRTDLQVKWVSLRPDVAPSTSPDSSSVRPSEPPRSRHRSAMSRRRRRSTSSGIPCASCRLHRRRPARERATSCASRPWRRVRPMPVSPPSRAGPSAASARRSMPTAALSPRSRARTPSPPHRRTIGGRHGHCGATRSGSRARGRRTNTAGGISNRRTVDRRKVRLPELDHGGPRMGL